MNEPRIYVDLPLEEGGSVTLSKEVLRHLVVLRRIRGDTVRLFNGQGGEYRAQLELMERKHATARVLEKMTISRESPLRITLAQAVSKGERMDYCIQKAVELGVHSIVPLLSDRSVVRLSAERWARKREHWQGIVVAACEQSGRTQVPTVHPTQDLRDWLPKVDPQALKLMLVPGAPPLPPQPQSPQAIQLLVGPEGGFTEVEMKLADLADFKALPLGPRTLRTETAGVVALSLLQSRWGDFGVTVSTES